MYNKRRKHNEKPLTYCLFARYFYKSVTPWANMCDYGYKRDKGFEPSPSVWKTDMLAIEHQSRNL